MHKFTLTLWTDEMVFTRGAIQEQLDRYSQGWRRTFINYDAGIAEVYLPAIRSCQRMLEQIDKVMPPIKD
jgi:hypothetical protein